MMGVTYFGPYSEGFIAGFINIMPSMTPGGKTTPALPPPLQDQHPTFIKTRVQWHKLIKQSGPG